MVWFRWGCTASCGWNVRCVGVRGDAWSVMLSPCNTENEERAKQYPGTSKNMFCPESVLSLGVCENRDGWLVAWGCVGAC